MAGSINVDSVLWVAGETTGKDEFGASGTPPSNLLIEAVASGYKIARGVAAITGSGTVVTGLATVVAVVATAADDLDGTALAGVSASIGDQAGSPAAGSIYLKCWKITAADNGALIAASAAKNVNWIAVGT